MKNKEENIDVKPVENEVSELVESSATEEKAQPELTIETEGAMAPMPVAETELPTMALPVQDVPEVTKKKSNKTVFVCVILLVVLAIVAGYYSHIMNNSKTGIVAKSLKHLEASVLNYTDFTLTSPSFKEFASDGKLTIKTEGEGAEALFGEFTKYGLEFEVEKKQESFYFDFSLLESAKSLLDLRVFGKENKIYVSAEKLFDKVIEMDYKTDLILEDNYVTSKDYNYLYHFIVEKAVLELDTSTIASSKAVIKLDGKDVNANKTSIILDSEKLLVLANKVVEALKKDKRANELMTKLVPTFAEFKFEAADLSEEIKFYYTVYTTGLLNKVLGVDFEVTHKYEEDTTLANLIEYRRGEFDAFYIKSGTIENNANPNDLDLMAKLVFKKEKNDLTIIAYATETQEVAKIVIKNPDANTLDAEMSASLGMASIKLAATMKMTEVTKDKEYKFTLNPSLAIGDGTSSLKVIAEIDANIRNLAGETASKSFDISNKVNYSELTQGDYLKIMENFQNAFLGTSANYSSY